VGRPAQCRAARYDPSSSYRWRMFHWSSHELVRCLQNRAKASFRGLVKYARVWHTTRAAKPQRGSKHAEDGAKDPGWPSSGPAPDRSLCRFRSDWIRQVPRLALSRPSSGPYVTPFGPNGFLGGDSCFYHISCPRRPR
jgi:hypothetical protein